MVSSSFSSLLDDEPPPPPPPLVMYVGSLGLSSFTVVYLPTSVLNALFISVKFFAFAFATASATALF